MTTFYVNPAASYNGDGTKTQPFKTVASLSVGDNDVIAIKAGTVLTESLQKFISRSNLRITTWGDGPRPILDGGLVLDNNKAVLVPGTSVYAFAFCFTGTELAPTATMPSVTVQLTSSTTLTLAPEKVTYRPMSSSSLDACVLGNVTEDGAPLFWVPWAGNLDSTIKNTPNSGQNSLPNKLDTPGRFTIDHVNKVLYIVPTYGLLTGSEYKASTLKFGIASSWPVDARVGGTIVEHIECRSHSKHGIVLSNNRGLQLQDIVLRQIGGIYDGSYYMGNGIELSNGTEDAYIRKCEAYDIFDSAYSPQTYEPHGSSIRRQDWVDLYAARTGMAAMEVSIQNGNYTGNTYKGSGVVEHINVYDLVHDNQARGWGGERGCHGFVVVNNGQDGCKLNNIRLLGAKLHGHGTGKGVLSSRTAGVNYYKGVEGGGYAFAYGFYGAAMQQYDVRCQNTITGATDIGSAVNIVDIKQLPV